MNNTYTVIFLLVCNIFSANAQQPMNAQLDSLLTTLCEEYKTVGASSVLIDTKKSTQFFSEYGYFGDTTKQVNTQTLFRVGSITKTFTAISIMQLVEQGKIDLNSPVEAYLRALENIKSPNDMQAYTVGHLLSHTSGLRGEMSNGLFSTELQLNCISEELKGDTLLTTPGEIYAYSNLGYGILGCLIESVSGMNYGDYIKKNIFEPIGMTSSGLYLDLMNSEKMSKGFKGNVVMPAESPVSYTSAGDIVTNTQDMFLFLKCLLNEGKSSSGVKIISSKSLELMQKNHNETSILNTGKKIGYGFFIKELTEERSDKKIKYFMHGGDTFLFHAYFGILPEEGVGIAVFTNSEAGNRVASKFKTRAAKLYLSKSKNTKITNGTDTFAEELFPREDNLPIEDLVGEYGLGVGNLTFKKKGKNKLKGKTDFKGPTVVIKQQDANIYSAKVILFGLIPIKIKELKFAFESKKNDTYLKMISQGETESEYMGKKRTNNFPTADWENLAGEYQVVNLKKGNATMIPFSIKIDNNLIYLTLKSSLREQTQVLTFEPVSNVFASSNVIGRGMGEYLKVLKNGNLFFSGFEMKKL